MRGFVSGVKGKLFELRYVDHLNDGNLPKGFTAEIAQSPVNPGWDIAIMGPDGATKDTIQAKATESVAYVKEALKEHPQIDVVTTSEVYSQLLMQGLAEGVINSGVTEDGLGVIVEGSVDDVTMTIDWVPSVVPLALIAFSTYNEEALSEYEQSRRFGERASKSYLAYLAGGTIAVATQTWWIGVIGGMGSRMLLGAGRRKRNRLSHLTQLVKSNEQVLGRLEKLAA